MPESDSLIEEVRNTPPIIRSDGSSYPPLSQKLQIFHALVTAGMDPAKAHSIANKGKKTDKTSVYKAQQRILSFQLARPKRIKAAAKAIDETLAMKSLEIKGKNGDPEYITPTISNRIEAAKMVMDRADPVHQVHEHHHVADLLPADMKDFEVIPATSVLDGKAQVE